MKPKTLLSIMETESWQRDNVYVLSGYRHQTYSFMASLASIFKVHNETGISNIVVNVWSHLAAAVYFLVDFVGITCFRFSFSNRDAIKHLNHGPDFAAISLYCLGVIVCFALSAAFHTFSDHSRRVYRFTNNLDHVGIVFVLWGTGVSCTHLAFRCAPSRVRLVYFGGLSVAASLCAVLTLRSCFHLPKFRMLRTLIYCFLSVSLFVPLYKAWQSFGSLEVLDKAVGLRSFLVLASVNSFGGVMYATRVPERWFPGKFDMLGHSHQWMHIMVTFGAILRLRGMLHVQAQWMTDKQMIAYCQDEV